MAVGRDKKRNRIEDRFGLTGSWFTWITITSNAHTIDESQIEVPRAESGKELDAPLLREARRRA
jgi:hypothetical protein